jgi:hypothetical protein
MKHNEMLEKLSKEELIRLIEGYSKNWLAMDGVWFQSVERKFGMDEAMFHDREIWRLFTVIEAKRIKEFLGLPARAGLDGLAKALQLRFYSNINKDEIIVNHDDNSLVYTTIDCRVQTARARKGMEFHPCKGVGMIEYGGFATTIDDRFSCECLSCFPDITDKSCACKWKFTLHTDEQNNNNRIKE